MNTAISGTFSGPDTVFTGQTATYSFTITRTGSSAGGGVDIATRLGTLNPGPGSAYLRSQNGELTQQNALNLSGGSFTGQFSYTAPASPGTDTLWLSEAIGYSNGWNWGTEKRIIVRTLVGINNLNSPAYYKLDQNFPNPFNPSTVINFEIPKNEFVSLKVFDISGREVTTLVNEYLQQGLHSFGFDINSTRGNYITSGIYYYTLKAGNFSDTKKMIVVK